jgi:2-polyprenyl-6-methoxyphenol hydroxylase-like FAD-dependent oxidoreductase
MSHPSIAIVGAGLGGLVLARILQTRGVPCAVYEADPAAGARQQGGLLDMHERSGQFALRAAGLHEEFCRLIQPQAEAMRILDRAGVFIDYAPKDGWGRPEIERTALRDLLIPSLDPATIAWGHKVTHVSSLGGGRHALAFADGRTVSTDLLVGADGTRSKVRPLLSAVTPEYCGIAHVELRLSDVKERHPDCAALVAPECSSHSPTRRL